MDTLTHALSGALLARLTAGRGVPPRSVPRRVAAGFFACAFPDADFVVSWLGPVEYLLHHRGATHSILLLPAWAWLCAWLLSKLLREPGGWRALYAPCAWGIGAHIAGDLITSYGTMVFAPLSDARLAWSTTFIIDLWFSGVILAGLFASAVWRRTRLPAAAAMAVLAGYVGYQSILRDRATEFGIAYAHSRGLVDAEVTAYPRPVSPFNWTVFVSDAREHRYAHVNLWRDEPRFVQPGDGFVARLDSHYLPLAIARWETRSRYAAMGADEAVARAAWESPALDFMRWFAAKPALDGVTPGPTCFWFIDLRFVNPGREWVPFRFGACRSSANAPWLPFERGPGSEPMPLRPGRQKVTAAS